MKNKARAGVGACGGGNHLAEKPEERGHKGGDDHHDDTKHSEGPISDEMQSADGVQSEEAQETKGIKAVLVVDLNDPDDEGSQGKELNN